MGRTYNTLEVIPSLLFQGNFFCGCPEEMATKEFSSVPSTQRFLWGKMTTLDLPAYSFSQLLWNFCFHRSKNIFSYLVGLATFSPLAPFGCWCGAPSLVQLFTPIPSSFSAFLGHLSDCGASCGSRLFLIVPYVSVLSLPLSGHYVT